MKIPYFISYGEGNTEPAMLPKSLLTRAFNGILRLLVT